MKRKYKHAKAVRDYWREKQRRYRAKKKLSDIELSEDFHVANLLESMGFKLGQMISQDELEDALTKKFSDEKSELFLAQYLSLIANSKVVSIYYKFRSRNYQFEAAKHE